MRVIERIKRATKTNDAQFNSVVLFSGLNLAAALSGENWDNIGLILFAICFWPVLAFIFNLISPIR